MNSKVRLTSPVGLFCWPKLQTPDYGSTEFPIEKGQYIVNVEFDPMDTEGSWAIGKQQCEGGWKSFVEHLQYIDDENYSEQCTAKGKTELKRRELFKECLDSDGNPTGKYQMVVKCKAVITKGKGKASEQDFENRPGLFDAGLKPLKSTIGGGSLGKVSLEPYGYFRSNTGAALYLTLQAAQITELKEQDGTGESYGFGVTDGYEEEVLEDKV